MRYRWLLAVSAILLFIASAALAADKTGARLERIAGGRTGELRVSTSLSAADTCLVSENGVLMFRINGWVTGAELYKSYMNPAASCDAPYPFTITEINMLMAFDTGTPLTVSVDVEAVDLVSVPGCTVPGELLAISMDWDLEVPAGGGIFDIWIPLDTPLIVNGPFFAGFFISNIIDPAVNAAVITDSLPVLCTSYNVWDETVGWVDLNNNSFFNFPGRLAMEVSGIPGGNDGGDDTTVLLQTAWVIPATGEWLPGTANLWVQDTAGTAAPDYTIFEYSFGGGQFVEIGRDLDGFSPLRGGSGSVASGSGFSLDWNFSSMSEGTYSLRATIFDTSGRSSAATIAATIEPTPPIPTILSPADGDTFCGSTNILVFLPDEDMTFIELFQKSAAFTFSAGLTPTSQFSAGDANGNTADGNLVANGEFGDYYSGPIAAAMALDLWATRGVSEPVMQGSLRLSISEVAELLAQKFGTRQDRGTFDENLVRGLQSFIAERGSTLTIDILRNPGYSDLRTWVEEQERVVLLGLSGPSGFWIGMDGFNGFTRLDGYHDIKIASPLTGAIELQPMRESGGMSELFFNSNWHRIDIMVSLIPSDWNASRQLVGVDFNGSDGWSVNWTPVNLKEDSLYYITMVGHDIANNVGSSTIMLQYSCSFTFARGDYNNDGFADIGDVVYLINYITRNGAAPAGGGLRSDANCDSFVNIADIIYYLNFLFGAADLPCY